MPAQAHASKKILQTAARVALLGLLINVVAAPDWSTSLATMMGIGIGIDYALLMVTRFREWRAVGLDPHAATVATLDTAGRAVLVAGSTVTVSMLGLFAVGLSVMNGTAVVTMIATLVVMAAVCALSFIWIQLIAQRGCRWKVHRGASICAVTPIANRPASV